MRPFVPSMTVGKLSSPYQVHSFARATAKHPRLQRRLKWLRCLVPRGASDIPPSGWRPALLDTSQLPSNPGSPRAELDGPGPTVGT